MFLIGQDAVNWTTHTHTLDLTPKAFLPLTAFEPKEHSKVDFWNYLNRMWESSKIASSERKLVLINRENNLETHENVSTVHSNFFLIIAKICVNINPGFF